MPNVPEPAPQPAPQGHRPFNSPGAKGPAFVPRANGILGRLPRINSCCPGPKVTAEASHGHESMVLSISRQGWAFIVLDGDGGL